MNLKTLEDNFFQFSAWFSDEKDVSPNTLRAYEETFRAFLRFLRAKGRDEVDHQAIRAYIAEVYAGLRKSSLSRKISAIRVFFRFLKKKGHARENPAALMKSPKAEKRLSKLYTVTICFHFLDTLNA